MITVFPNTNKIKLVSILLNVAFHMQHSELATAISMVHNAGQSASNEEKRKSHTN